nr:Ppx/GppA phosphatase family protein [Roseibium sp. RKSG952]
MPSGGGSGKSNDPRLNGVPKGRSGSQAPAAEQGDPRRRKRKRGTGVAVHGAGMDRKADLRTGNKGSGRENVQSGQGQSTSGKLSGLKHGRGAAVTSPAPDAAPAADRHGRASARHTTGKPFKNAGFHCGNGVSGGKPLYAALDLGTNNCRLLIARPEERGFRVVDAYSRIVRLGEGVGANRRLSEAAMDRAVEALANCRRKLSDRGVERSRLIATEACRAAENGMAFIDRVHAETGLSLEVVDRETEARLAVAGCVSLVDQEADGVILFDIGGGSSEIVWLDLRNRCGARGYALTRFIRSWTSLPVGVVNLAERHGGVDVTPAVFEAMVADVSDHLSAFALGSDLSSAIASGAVHMLGTSGTVTTLAGVHFGLKRYDRRRVDGAWLDNAQVTTMIDRLRGMPYEERVDNPCIGADRADLVLAGCAILEAIRRRWSCSRLRVADRGLREGILTELMAADGVWSRRRRQGGRERGQYRGKS